MKHIGDIALEIRSKPITRTDVCETHGPFESQNFVGKIWSRCPVCAKEKERKEREAAEAKVRAERLRAWQAKIGGAGIPERFHDRTLESFVATSPEQAKALAFSKAYADGFDDVIRTGRSAMFLGKPGTGKTHLAVGIALQVMREQGRTVLFTTVMRAIRRVKDSWSRESSETESDAIRSLVFPDLLILDEVGVQFGSDFERNILFDVLNERYEKRRPTLLLSNLLLDDVRAFLGERVMDRMREDGGRVIPFVWESHRKRPVEGTSA